MYKVYAHTPRYGSSSTLGDILCRRIWSIGVATNRILQWYDFRKFATQVRQTTAALKLEPS